MLIIPFLCVADAFTHSCNELYHGWKLHDYLIYTRYRFLQRETRWKGMEDSLDECIDESLRTLDQMCFSSQYYMMMTIHVNGIFMMSLGIEFMLSVNYNFLGDQAVLVIIPFVIWCSLFVKKTLLFLAVYFKLWRIKHENTAWHTAVPEEDEFDIPGWEDLDGASHDAFIMNQRITSETFRFKFLNYNRSWLINQLPSILTPRTMQRSRPYLINQFQRILSSLNQEISDDDEADAAPQFGPVALSAPSRQLVRWWLAQARRRMRLREVVQPLINKARGTQCEVCLSRKQLNVECVVPLETLAEKFDEEHPEDEFDQVQGALGVFKCHLRAIVFTPRLSQHRSLCSTDMATLRRSRGKRFGSDTSATGPSASPASRRPRTRRAGRRPRAWGTRTRTTTRLSGAPSTSTRPPRPWSWAGTRRPRSVSSGQAGGGGRRWWWT